MFKENQDKFGHFATGVHGVELPKFDSKEGPKHYWKVRKDYVEAPKYTSQKQMIQDSKYWAQNDELLINATKKE
jgi:hypothetical protein